MTPLSPQKPFISPPHSPAVDGFSSGSNSPVESPSVSRSNSGISLTSAKRLSRSFTSEQARRRGYVRPQGTEFAKSARSRNSVMALGSIAHVQHFFAKTGLLDGKGGGFKRRKSKSHADFDPVAQLRVDTALIDSTYSSLRSSPELYSPGEAEKIRGGNAQQFEDFDDDPDMVLPPTVSTYKPSTPTLPPPPDRETLREDLREALDNCKRNWIEAAGLDLGANGENAGPRMILEEHDDSECESPIRMSGNESSDEELNSVPALASVKDVVLHNLLRSTTIAVRTAKEYYYATDFELVSGFTTEKKLRADFISILDVLKRITLREGGEPKPDEKDAVVAWVDTIENLLDKEEGRQEEGRRAGQVWLEGNWNDRQWERYHLFLSYFDAYTGAASSSPLPQHDVGNPEGSPLMKVLQNGDRLIMLHNAIVRRSRRPFGQIPTWHSDFNKPYRMAENLRYWAKASEIRWECKLEMDVMGTVFGTPEGMESFEASIAKWCESLIYQVKREWREDEEQQTLLGIAEKKERRKSRRLDSTDSY